MQNKKLSFTAFMLYFLAGAEGALISGSITHLVIFWGLELDRIVLFSSAYSLGRSGMVYLTGHLCEKVGPKKVLTAGLLLILIYLLGFPSTGSFPAALVFAFVGGAGMTVQDTAGPVLMGMVSGSRGYAGTLSIGQALFGLGGFAAPFAVGLLTSFDLSFKIAFYLFALAPIAMLVIMLGDRSEVLSVAKTSKAIKPLYSRNAAVAFAALAVFVLCYDAAGGVVGLYATSYAKAMGISDSAASFILSLYQASGVAGSFAFASVLKKYPVTSVVVVNLSLAAVSVLIGITSGSRALFYLMFALLGFFSRPVFSMMVSIATRIGYKHVSLVGSILGLVSGAVGVLMPVMTGNFVKVRGAGVSMAIYLCLCLVCIAAAAAVKIYTCEVQEKEEI